MPIALRYAARSDLGLGPKSRNEDSGYAGPHLLVLADGMGGHAAGDVASSMIVGELAPLDGESIGADTALPTLQRSIRDANTRLRMAMREDPQLSGMGSTTIAMLRTGNKLAMAHIGDSRAYLLRDGTFSQITKDHS
ncbi:MAG: protein phosphatase 2C domain-containing protein, partial [Lapillicoccus sp.]